MLDRIHGRSPFTFSTLRRCRRSARLHGVNKVYKEDAGDGAASGNIFCSGEQITGRDATTPGDHRGWRYNNTSTSSTDHVQRVIVRCVADDAL